VVIVGRQAVTALLSTAFIAVSDPGGMVTPRGCDPDLIAHAEPGLNGYRWRDDRCEGIYVPGVSGEGSFLIASISRVRSAHISAAERSILLQWKAEADHTALHIRAYPLRPDLHYQMDTLQRLGVRRYRWPSRVLADLDIDFSDIGVVAWEIRSFHGQRVNAYIPITIGNDSSAFVEPRLTALPGREMREVYVTVARLDDKGSVVRVIRDRRALNRGSYAAQTSIEISLPELRSPGLYGIQLEGEVQGEGVGGGVVSTPMIAVLV
jgi:hypothetical protein